jgi:hypothetical protein
VLFDLLEVVHTVDAYDQGTFGNRLDLQVPGNHGLPKGDIDADRADRFILEDDGPGIDLPYLFQSRGLLPGIDVEEMLAYVVTAGRFVEEVPGCGGVPILQCLMTDSL